MPRLECSVTNCRYNKEHGCIRENISVGGAGASSTSETCCDSFEERKGDSYSNVTGEASPTSTIDCKATDCTYNNECKCHAGKISVEGSSACHCDQTECATFTCGCK